MFLENALYNLQRTVSSLRDSKTTCLVSHGLLRSICERFVKRDPPNYNHALLIIWKMMPLLGEFYGVYGKDGANNSIELLCFILD